MKTKEELNALKVEVETVNKKLAELTEEELAQVSGGQGIKIPTIWPPRTLPGTKNETEIEE